MMPWNKEKFWAIMYNASSDSKQKEYAEDQGMSPETAEKVAKEVPNE